MRALRCTCSRCLSVAVSLVVTGCGGSHGGAPVDIVPPTVPTGLNAVAASSTSIELSWNASTDDSGAVGYLVSRDGIDIGVVGATSFLDERLQPSTTYAYQVVARDPWGNASPPASASAGTQDPTLYRVWGLQAGCGQPGECSHDALLGEARTTHTFQGVYPLYAITVSKPDRCQLDAAGFSDGTYISSLSPSSNTLDVTNAHGPPDGAFATVGLLGNCPFPDTWGCYLGGWAVLRPQQRVTGVTIYLAP